MILVAPEKRSIATLHQPANSARKVILCTKNLSQHGSAIRMVFPNSVDSELSWLPLR